MAPILRGRQSAYRWFHRQRRCNHQPFLTDQPRQQSTHHHEFLALHGSQRVAIREEQEIRDDASIAAEVDLSEMVGDYTDVDGGTNGMQIAGPEELEPSGFEDVDLSVMQGED